jgi:oligosaccharide repeat unit polymerase
MALIDSIRIDKDVLSYRIMAQLVLLTYSLPSAIAALSFPDDPQKMGYIISGNINNKTIFSVLFIFTLMHIGMFIGASIKGFDLKILRIGYSHQRLNSIGWVLFLISLVPILLIFSKSGWSVNTIYLESFYMLKLLIVKNKFLLYLGFLTILPMCWLIITNVSQRKYLIVILLFIIIALVTLIKPSRGLFLTVFLATLLSYHYFIKRLTIKKALIYFICLSVLSLLILQKRIIDSNHDNKLDPLFNVFEGRIIFENTYLVYDYLENTEDFRWGETYFTAITHTIPEGIISGHNKMPISVWFEQYLYGNIDEKRSGRMFSIVAEAYMNFYFLGPLLLGVFYTYFLKTLYLSMIESIKNMKNMLSLGTIIYFYFCTQIYYFIRGDITSFFVRTEALVVFPLIIFVGLSETLNLICGSK